ncbi:hypothetical protein V2J09_005160 [Rumex salicifolius]
MAMAGLYRRVLPSPPAIDFASPQGKQLFIEAIENGTMEAFYRLISHFQTQSEPAYCGLASLSMVLNALAIDPGRTWKGPWRWYDESMLDCCEPLEKVKDEGISFGKLASLARCAGAKVSSFSTTQSSIDQFRNYVNECSKSDDRHLISSYHRGVFKQTGAGHFSPIGGYHPGKDMALILDVARFKYPPHWVPLTLLWEAMDTDANGNRRGFMLISRNQREPALLYTLSCKHESWISMAKYLMDDLPLLLNSKAIKDVEGVLQVVCMSLPSNFREFIKWVAEVRMSEDVGQSLSQEEIERLSIKEEILKQVRETHLYKHVSKYLYSVEKCCREKPGLGIEHNLTDIAGSICCQGAELYSGKSGWSGRFCCLETCVNSLKDNGGKPITMVSGMVANGQSRQGLQVLIPSSPNKPVCCSAHGDTNNIHPGGYDILTVLLLALPAQTWTGIKNEKLVQEMLGLVSTENLPTLLQEEVIHLHRQLVLLKRCKDDKVDNDLVASSL